MGVIGMTRAGILGRQNVSVGCWSILFFRDGHELSRAIPSIARLQPSELFSAAS
jgi:hypothetical protein